MLTRPALRRYRAFARTCPLAGDWHGAQVLKSGAEALVVALQTPQGPAVLKIYAGAQAAAQAERAVRVLTRQAGRMQAGASRVPRLIADLSPLGATLTSQAQGTRLDRIIAAAPAQRAALLARAANWLACFIGEAHNQEPFGGRYWPGQRARDLAGLVGPDRALADALLARIEGLRASLAGTPIAKCEVHGDFAPINIIDDGAVMTGIDLQSDHRMPPAKEVARFAVYLAATHPGPGPLWHGLPLADLAPFTDHESLLAGPDRAAFLPFFIAVELADKFARNHGRDAKSIAIRSAIRACLGQSPAF